MSINILEGVLDLEKIESYINREDIYRYLNGYSVASSKSEYWTQTIEAVLKECLQYSRPIFTSQKVDVSSNTETGELKVSGDLGLTVQSHDLTELLGNSEQMYIVGVTLGLVLDRKIQYYMNSDATKGVILDACASVVIEACCDFIQDKLVENDLEDNVNLYHTNRYSPGYGDLPLDVLKPFSDLIQMTKRTGIHVSAHFLMQPQKSVVFVIGISETPLKKATAICEHKCFQCKLKSCQYRVGVANDIKTEN